MQIDAEKVGADTYFARILVLVKESLAQRSPGEVKAEALAERLSYLGVAATIGTFLVTADPTRVFAVMLVMACPCATVLAATTAVTAALANAADNLILIKGGTYLERFGETDCLCLDKTGTLTSDQPQVIEVVSPSGLPSREVLFLAAVAEHHNPHPVSRAIQTHKVTKPLIWLGLSLAVIGATIFHRVHGWTTIVQIQAAIALVLIFNGIFLSFWVSPFMLQREKEGKSAEILPNSWQQKITVAFIISFLGWWSCLLLTVIDILVFR